MADYLLEIGLEEVPAGTIGNVIAQLEKNAAALLDKNRIVYGSIRTYATPRRIALEIRGLAELGESITVENRGPSVAAAYKDGQPTKALEGFCRGQGIVPDAVVVREVGKDSYVFCIKELPGISVRENLAALMAEAIDGLSFSKPMKWGSGQLAFIRPIRFLVSLLDSQVLPFEYAGITAGRHSRGHRFLGDGPVEIRTALSYVEDLEKGFVIADAGRRKDLILSGIREKEEELNLKIVVREELLNEVLFLVEYPTVFVGGYSEAYLRLPKEVIITTMVNNQKYFPVVDQDGNLKPYFIGVRCGNATGLEVVAKGNEKVLKARLDDAGFFFEEDSKVPLLDLRSKLDKVIYQEKLGSIGDKIDRITALAEFLAAELKISNEDLRKSASLAKMDLASHMVYEFPELQGIMGSYYSLLEGYSREISESIREHYLPVAAGDDVAHSELGILVSLADKFDSITSIFKAGLIPTGSQDPYALRRMALGVIRTILENGLKLSFTETIGASQRSVGHLEDLPVGTYSDFFKARFKSLLEKEGLRFDLIESILGLDFDDIDGLYKKALALKEFSESGEFANVVQLLVRTGNILKKYEGQGYTRSLLVDKHEIGLEEAFSAMEGRFLEDYAAERYLDCFKLLEQLEEPLDSFFENVMVMIDDPAIRENRLGLLAQIRNLGEQLFVAGQIVIQ